MKRLVPPVTGQPVARLQGGHAARTMLTALLCAADARGAVAQTVLPMGFTDPSPVFLTSRLPSG